MPRANHYVGLKSFKPSQETMDEAICADRSRYLLWFLPVSNPTDNPKLFISRFTKSHGSLVQSL